MNGRLAIIHARKLYSADTTEVIDIDVVDPISNLIIELAVVNTASAAPTAHAIACLTKIELVDGSNVLFSLSGYEAEAADYFHNGRLRSNWNPYLSGMETQRFIGINFGRHLWDPLLALDPKKFANLQLKLSLDIDAGGCSPSGNRLQVWANIFDEKKVSPIGFLMHKEIKSYPMAASAWEYTDMPTDYPYRKLFVRCRKAGTEACQLINKVKLSEDQDKRIPFEEDTADIVRTIAERLPIIHETIYGYVGTAATYGYCTPTERVNGICQRWAATTGAGEIAFYDGDGGRFAVIAATAASNMQVLVSGWTPHATIEIPFGDQNDVNDWYDVTKLGSVKCNIESTLSASSSESVQISLQQLKRY